MSRKSELYAALKAQGGVDRHYREYTVEELESRLDAVAMGGAPGEAADRTDVPIPPPPPAAPSKPPTAGPDLLHPDVIRVDEQGRQWLQEEVRKPAYPKPRGRRVLTYVETGVEKETIKVGDYIETFEVAGQGPGRTSEIKITLPSFQTGIYIDPRFPMFKVHTYNDAEGFDFHDVNAFYGGPELVPETVKRIYVSSDLCYDIRSVIRTVQSEYRQMQLTGGLK